MSKSRTVPLRRRADPRLRASVIAAKPRKSTRFVSAFRERLGEARARSGLSRRDVAQRLGVSVSAVTQWENGVVVPSPENIVRIAQLLATRVEWLMTGEHDDAAHIEALYRALDRRHRQILARLAKALLGAQRGAAE